MVCFMSRGYTDREKYFEEKFDRMLSEYELKVDSLEEEEEKEEILEMEELYR